MRGDDPMWGKARIAVLLRRNGRVERNNGAWRYEFYATWDLPNDDLDDINRWIDAFADESTLSRLAVFQ